jgi:hypothetical protein
MPPISAAAIVLIATQASLLSPLRPSPSPGFEKFSFSDMIRFGFIDLWVAH